MGWATAFRATIVMWMTVGSSHVQAACPASATVLSELTCSSEINTTIYDADPSHLNSYTCGTPYAPLDQTEGEHIYSFECQVSGSVTLEVVDLACDLDIYVLNSTCSPSTGCVAGATNASTSTDSITFSCLTGQTYYIVIEGYGFTPGVGEPGDCDGSEGHYKFAFDVSAGTGCPEDCNNGIDDDFDSDIDCDDTDCIGDPACTCDLDGDGYDGSVYAWCGGGDCDDYDAAIYPGANEVCNGIDDNCNALVDEADPLLDLSTAYAWYPDVDGDGFGDVTAPIFECDLPSGYVATTGDCDDFDAAINPGATEVCDGIDNDCDTLIDDADPSLDGGTTSSWHPDLDGDGYGSSTLTVDACDAPYGFISDDSDCDDYNFMINPAAAEICDGLDNDCDTLIDDADPDVVAATMSTWFADADSDAYGDPTATVLACSTPSGYTATSGDCDDSNAAINPAATEVCDNLDNDCDTLIDELDPSLDTSTLSTWYGDLDGDTYGDPSLSIEQCDPPAGTVGNGDDCDDSDPLVNPAAAEVCDGIDNDCDTLIDDDDPSLDGTTTTAWYADADGDTYGDFATATNLCDAPPGYITDFNDCDDSNAAINPAASEICDGLDNDCDGLIDNADPSLDPTSMATWYLDADLDGYGNPAISVEQCSPLDGYVGDDTDCDDADYDINPGAAEICDGIDNDCDGLVDEDDPAIEWFADTDLDGFGDPFVSIWHCDEPTGYVGDNTDCDDTNPDINPAAVEIPYDGIDQDCDGADLTDLDGDGYDAEVVGGDDCDDTDATVHPGVKEVADGVDEDCDDIVDEETEWYDDDGDGFTETGGDCDDANADVNPSEREECDGIDEDCDGIVDEGTECYDDDGDGYTELDGDCDDTNPAINPGATEILGNGVDDDCDGGVDGAAYDPDGDGYTAVAGDCDNNDPDVHPGAPELEDGKDNDCDGIVDEGTDAYDDDGDGYSENEGDCNDNSATTYPGAPEIIANGVDDDCDGLVDEGTDSYDDDGDGFSENQGDCDDTQPTVYPGAEEVENGRDDDCDGEVDEGILDLDNDGFSTEQGDCDDTNGWANPGADEMCDGVDNNCDGIVDEDCAQGDTGLLYGDSACNCASGPGPVSLAAWLMGLLLLGYRRRRTEGIA